MYFFVFLIIILLLWFSLFFSPFYFVKFFLLCKKSNDNFAPEIKMILRFIRPREFEHIYLQLQSFNCVKNKLFVCLSLLSHSNCISISIAIDAHMSFALVWTPFFIVFYLLFFFFYLVAKNSHFLVDNCFCITFLFSFGFLKKYTTNLISIQIDTEHMHTFICTRIF